ncbi:MAG: peptidylprolyl isomerase [Syntrophales bacterium]|nr:peptidylprolyl isomerase [Syntrophales bacterium]
MKGRRLLLGIFLIGILAPATGLSTVVDRIVAVVNDDIITLSDLESTFHPYQKRIDATYKGVDKDKIIAGGRITVLNRMIDNRLIEQWSKKAGIVVKDDDVMDTIKDLLRRRNISMEAFTQTLEREGSSLEAYRQDMKDQMTRMRLLRRELKTKILVSDDEIGEHYVKHRDEYEGKEAVRIKQILILLPQNPDLTVKARLKANAESIHKRLIDGESFDLLAAQFSQGPSAATGGDVGFLEKGTMLPEVDAVAFRLTKDEISEIIVSPVGLHIIKVLDRRGAGVKPIGVVREEIKAKLEEEKMEKSYEEWIIDLRKRSHVEIRL